MNEHEFRRNKQRIMEEMFRRREDRIGIEEIDISEPEPYVDPIKKQQEEDIQRVRIRMQELRQQRQNVKVEKPRFSCDDIREFQRRRERVLDRLYLFAQDDKNLEKIKEFLERNGN